MLVKDIMTPNVYTINQNQTLLELQGLMSDDHIRRVPVLNDAGQVVGIITDKDVKLASPSEASTLSRYEASYLLSRIKVKDVMTHNVKTVYATADLADVAALMYQDHIASVPVMDEVNNNLCGIVTDSDVFRALVDIFGLGQSASRITIDVSDKPGVLAEVAKMFADRGINIISCVTSETKVAGEKELTITADLSQIGLGIVEELREAGFTVTNISTIKAK
ncbi:MAG: CBS domain-containing protein [Acidaminococcaceae bacterium]|nr:CBS domain-containing protein [Acidaminococcaceae bacterium]